METHLGNTRAITKLDIAIFLVTFAILAVVAVPRYNRATKTEEAKLLIQEMNKATDEVINELVANTAGTDTIKAMPKDEQLLELLKKHFNGSIPFNPFTKNNDVAIIHENVLKPCDCLTQRGGWIWDLSSSMQNGKPANSRVWLNSDTVHLGEGHGESCIQPESSVS